MCFLKVDASQVRWLKDILKIFETISGLKINLSKTSTAGIEVRGNVLLQIGQIPRCKVVDWPLKYLDLPLGGAHRSLSFWDPVIERIQNKLDSWKKGYISLGGRITLIKTVLSNFSIYYMSLFKMPEKRTLKVEKLHRDFLWEGGLTKDHLVGWKKVCCPKKEGGLGIGRIKERSLALMGKWL